MSSFASQLITPTGSQNVKFFGARGDGITDDTAAISAAILSAAGGEVYFPTGIYRHTGFSINVNGTKLRGSSNFSSVLRFDPPDATAVGITYSLITPTADAPLEDCGISNLAMCGNGLEATTNIMVDIVDTREFKWESCRIGQISITTPTLAWGGIGLRVRGRDTAKFDGVLISCDCPIEFKANPVSSPFIIDCDHFTFTNCDLMSWTGSGWGSVRYLIEIDDGLRVDRLTFDGHQAWGGGGGGLRWIDTTSVYMGVGWNIGNVRYEKAASMGLLGWIIYISKTGIAQPLVNPHFHDIVGGEVNDYSGIYLRGCWSPHIEDFIFQGDSSNVWLDIDATVTKCRVRACAQLNGATLDLNDSNGIDNLDAALQVPGEIILYGTSTDNTPVVLTLDGLAPSASNRLIVPDGESWGLDLLISCRCTAGVDAGRGTFWHQISQIQRAGATTALSWPGPMNVTTAGAWSTVVFTPSAYFHANLATITAIITADDANEALAVTCTGVVGAPANTFRWTARVRISKAP